jgi:hypothetical protein
MEKIAKELENIDDFNRLILAISDHIITTEMPEDDKEILLTLLDELVTLIIDLI